MFARLSLHSHISKTTRTNLTKFLVARFSSVDNTMLCTASFVDVCTYNPPVTPHSSEMHSLWTHYSLFTATTDKCICRWDGWQEQSLLPCCSCEHVFYAITALLLLLLLHLFQGLFSRTTWVSQYQKGKPFWILLEQEMMGWQWHQLDHMQIICTSLQTDNHTSTSPLNCHTKTEHKHCTTTVSYSFSP